MDADKVGPWAALMALISLQGWLLKSMFKAGLAAIKSNTNATSKLEQTFDRFCDIFERFQNGQEQKRVAV